MMASAHASRVEARKAATSKGMGASHAAHHQGSRPVAKYCNTPDSNAAPKRQPRLSRRKARGPGINGSRPYNGQIQRRQRATRGADRWNLRLADPSVILPPDALTFPVVGPRIHLTKPGQHHSQGSPVNADLVRARHEGKLPNYPTE